MLVSTEGRRKPVFFLSKGGGQIEYPHLASLPRAGLELRVVLDMTGACVCVDGTLRFADRRLDLRGAGH